MLLRFLRFFTERARARDAGHWQRWEKLRQVASEYSDEQLGIVTSIRQTARNGTKGYITWFETGDAVAFWSKDYFPSTGNGLVVTGNHGHGGHHDEPVFYIKTVRAEVPAKVHRGWRRHGLRLRARGKVELTENAPAADANNNGVQNPVQR